MTETGTYVRAAAMTLKKAKAFCRYQSTEEPQVLVLGELLERWRLADIGLLYDAVTRIGGSQAAQDPNFTMTPARIVAEARALRDDRAERQPTPAAIGNAASEEQRAAHMAEIRRIVGRLGSKFGAMP